MAVEERGAGLSESEQKRREQLKKDGKEHEIEFMENDHVQTFVYDDEFKNEIQRFLDENSIDKTVPEFWKNKYLNETRRNWDIFYNQKQEKFWKDRSWLFREFPELSPHHNRPHILGLSDEEVDSVAKESPHDVLVEIGCGNGSTIFPVLQRNPFIDCYAFDFSAKAIDTVKKRWERSGSDPELPKLRGSLTGAHVWDITEDIDTTAVDPAIQCDILTCIFVLSALPSNEREAAAARLVGLIKSKGILLFRDYCRYDELQKKFVSSKLPKEVEANFYVRGDGTLQYYWTLEEADMLFEKLGMRPIESKVIPRLFTNRRTQQKLHRVWVQGKYQKL